MELTLSVAGGIGMAGQGRAVRCSARLSTGGGGGGGSGAGGGEDRAGRTAARREQAGAAAARRARAAERAREVEDSPRELRDKCRRLARALQRARHLVVYTGAGISTAADIPDYRGPRGVWTRLQRGERAPRVDVAAATPTYTHMALTALWARGLLKFVVSQNCDGLHVRAGLPRRALAELHGNMFAERCAACRRVYLRAFDTTERTARHAHHTRRLCHACGARLHDTIVHFGERGRAAWPLNWAGALRHAAAADVVLCLGSSLKVLRRYPRLWRMQRAPHRRPQLYIVNLQWTPKDHAAKLKINARCDAVMAQVARRLRLRVPRYSPRADPLLAHAEPLAPPELHTTQRRPLPAPSRSPSPATSWGSWSSGSDSDDEVPLRRLAERLRAPPSHPPHPAPPAHAAAPLHAFQVSLSSGEATILLRAHHAPPPALRPLSELRRFRMARPHRAPAPAPLNTHPILNGHLPLNGHPQPLNGHSSALLPPPPAATKKEEDDKKRAAGAGSWALGSRLRHMLAGEGGGGAGAGGGDAGAASALAAAIIARAVLLCRASLYPGLHTIIAPPAPAPPPPAAASPPAQCSWCVRHMASRRCLWYGPPAHTALERRAWRRERGRRYLCTCCSPDGEGAGVGERGAAGAGGEDECGAGWYGKGYRKGRRRRR